MEREGPSSDEDDAQPPDAPHEEQPAHQPLRDNEIELPVIDLGIRERDSESSDGEPNENVQNGYVYMGEPNWLAGGLSPSTGSSLYSGEFEEPREFDPELPTRHVYLGEGMEELVGRTVLEEDLLFEVPIVAMNFQLLPGQTLPMTVFHSAFQNAIRRCVVSNERVFGIVCAGVEPVDGRTVINRGAIGCLAEIYEFQEEADDPPPPSFLQLNHSSRNFAIKAKGSQRFNVMEVRRQGDGSLLAKIKIRPEIQLPSFFSNVVLDGTRRFQFDQSSSSLSEEGEEFKDKQTVNELTDEVLCERISRNRRISRYYSALTPWPAFVYNHYDESLIVQKIHRILRNELKGLSESHSSIPISGQELSYWLAQNLTVDDSIRLSILRMDCCIQRLRFQLNLLQNASRKIECRSCSLEIADQADIFSMSSEGPQGTYVNPNGFIHECLSLAKVKDVTLRGYPSLESSWFQAYSWTIVECSGCGGHLGWKFKAVTRGLIPRQFFGLARKQISFTLSDRKQSSDSVSSHSIAPSTEQNPSE